MPRAKKSPRPLNEAINTGHPAAAAVAPGLPYGQRQAIEQSLAQAPIPGPQAQPTPGQAVAPTADPFADAQATPFNPVGMFAPTGQPDTPITAGLPSGPGPGPEALAPPPNPDAAALKSLVPLLEILASGPESTYATRNFLRTLRSNVGAQ